MFGQQKLVNIDGKIYTITKQIGYGNQGDVFKGLSQKGEEVAIKYQYTISSNEYQILQQLQKNPQAHIIGIKEVQKEQDGNTLIVMELADEELYTYMTNNPEYKTLSKVQKNQIFYQMVKAVKELHELGYFHRDLKPENFVVFKKDANGFIKTKLIDLGLCKQQLNLRHTKNVGTPYYMAPEVVNGSLLYDHSVDSWALDCIWYELMTGNIFFNGTNKDEIFQKIQNSNQFQIDQQIESQQIFNEKEKQLLKSLIKIDANSRIQVKELAQRLLPYQNNTSINQNFNNIRIQKFYKTQNNPSVSQYSQFQNINQFNQTNNININQENYNQNLNSQQKQNQMNDWKQNKKSQMQQEYEQNLKAEFEQQVKIETERIRKEEEAKLEKKFLDEKKKQDEILNIKLKQIEEDLKKKNEQYEQKKRELDKQKFQELQVEQELKMQIELEEKKKKLEEEQRKQQEQLRRVAEEKMRIQLKQKEEELSRSIAEQLQQQYLIKYNQELQQKEQQYRQEMEKIFCENKIKVKNLIKNSKELIEKCIQSLVEKCQDKLICESQNFIPQQQKEFQDMIQNFVSQFKQKITEIEENENILQQINDFEQLHQILEFEKQLNENNQQIAQDQINFFNEITQKYNELVQYLINQKQLKEKLEKEQKQQSNQLLQLQIQYQSYTQQVKKLKSNLENQQRNSQQMISQLDDNEVIYQSKQINLHFEKIHQKLQQFKQQTNEFVKYEIQIQIQEYNQINSQLLRIFEELEQLITQQQLLNLKVEKVFQNLKTQINERIKSFQNCAQNFSLLFKKYNRDQEQLNQELNKLQCQGSNFLIQQNLNQFKELVTQMESLLKQFETGILHSKSNYNSNNLIQCQYQIQDLEKKQNQLSNLDKKMIQLGRITSQQYQIIQLKEENKKILHQLDQQQQTLSGQFHNFSQLSGEIQQQIDLFLNDFNGLKNQFKTELKKLDQQTQETEEQLIKQTNDYKTVSNTYMLQFEEKKSKAEILLQKFLQYQTVLAEKQKSFNQFNIQCNEVKHQLQQFRFENNYQIFHQIRNYSCQQQMGQCINYFLKCKEMSNENSNVIQLEMNNLEKFNLQVQKKLLSEMIQKQKVKSARAIDDLNQFYNQSIKPHYQENFDQIEQGDEQLLQELTKCKEIQERANQLSQINSDQFQNASDGQITNQDFTNQIKRDTEELIKQQKALQQINLKELQQFNEKIPNKVNSWFIQMLLINIILSYQNVELVQRKYQKSEEKGNKEQCKQLLDEGNKLKNLMLQSQNHLDKKQFNELNVEDLIENQRQLKESIDKDLSEIKNKNRIKLRGFVKNQEIVKEIIEMTQVEEYSKTIEFHKLQQLLKL